MEASDGSGNSGPRAPKVKRRPTVSRRPPEQAILHPEKAKPTSAIKWLVGVALVFVIGAVGFFNEVFQLGPNFQQFRLSLHSIPLNGRWYALVMVHESEVRSHRGMVMAYSLTLQPDGAQGATGSGQLICTNGEGIIGHGQRPIEVSMSWNADKTILMDWKETSWKIFHLASNLSYEKKPRRLWGTFQSTIGKESGGVNFLLADNITDVFALCADATKDLKTRIRLPSG